MFWKGERVSYSKVFVVSVGSGTALVLDLFWGFELEVLAFGDGLEDEGGLGGKI